MRETLGATGRAESQVQVQSGPFAANTHFGLPPLPFTLIPGPQDTYVGSPSLMVPSARQTISRRAPSMNWASQPMLPTKKHALT